MVKDSVYTYIFFSISSISGALLIKNTSVHILKKRYFGGGTVDMAGVDEFFHHPRNEHTQW